MNRGTLMFDSTTTRCFYVFADGSFDELPLTITSSRITRSSGVIDHGHGIYEKAGNPPVRIEMECYVPDHCIRDFSIPLVAVPVTPQEPQTSWAHILDDTQELE